MKQHSYSQLNLKPKNFLSLLIGTFLMAVSINGLLRPNEMLSGGVSGISLFIHFISGTSISLLTIAFNIPLFILAFIFLKKRFICLSLMGMSLLSFWLEITSSLVIPTENYITVILVSGVLSGAGMGIIFRADGSVGGTDIIAKILNQKYSLSMGSVIFSINLLIMFTSILYFGLDKATLTAASMFVSSKMTNFVVDGMNRRRTASIITTPELGEAIAKAIMDEMHRGVTIVPAIGGYTHKDKYILYTTVNLREVSKLKFVVSNIDTHAFLTIADTAQVIGNGKGFIPFSDAS